MGEMQGRPVYQWAYIQKQTTIPSHSNPQTKSVNLLKPHSACLWSVGWNTGKTCKLQTERPRPNLDSTFLLWGDFAIAAPEQHNVTQKNPAWLSSSSDDKEETH